MECNRAQLVTTTEYLSDRGAKTGDFSMAVSRQRSRAVSGFQSEPVRTLSVYKLHEGPIIDPHAHSWRESLEHTLHHRIVHRVFIVLIVIDVLLVIVG